MWVVLILGLIAAGIYTENAAFYFAAGIAGAVIVLWMFLAGLAVKKIHKKMDDEFNSFKINRRF